MTLRAYPMSDHETIDGRLRSQSAHDTAELTRRRSFANMSRRTATMAICCSIMPLTVGLMSPTVYEAWAVEPTGGNESTVDSPNSTGAGEAGQTGSEGNSSQTGPITDPSDSNGNSGGDSQTGDADVKKTHTIRLHWGAVQGGVVGSIDVADGETATPVEGKAVAGWKFTGWCADEACTRPFDWTRPVTTDVDAWAGYVEDKPAYSLSDLASVKPVVDGETIAAGAGSVTRVRHDARVSLTGVPDGWTVTTSNPDSLTEKLTVSSPDGSVSASWSFKRDNAPEAKSTTSNDSEKPEATERPDSDSKKLAGSKPAHDEPATGDSARETDGRGKIIALIVLVILSLVAGVTAVLRLKRLDPHHRTDADDGRDGGDDSGQPAASTASSSSESASMSVASKTVAQTAPTMVMSSTGNADDGLAALVQKTTTMRMLPVDSGQVAGDGGESSTRPSRLVADVTGEQEPVIAQANQQSASTVDVGSTLTDATEPMPVIDGGRSAGSSSAETVTSDADGSPESTDDEETIVPDEPASTDETTSFDPLSMS